MRFFMVRLLSPTTTLTSWPGRSACTARSAYVDLDHSTSQRDGLCHPSGVPPPPLLLLGCSAAWAGWAAEGCMPPVLPLSSPCCCCHDAPSVSSSLQRHAGREER